MYMFVFLVFLGDGYTAERLGIEGVTSESVRFM